LSRLATLLACSRPVSGGYNGLRVVDEVAGPRRRRDGTWQDSGGNLGVSWPTDTDTRSTWASSYDSPEVSASEHRVSGQFGRGSGLQVGGKGTGRGLERGEPRHIGGGDERPRGIAPGAGQGPLQLYPVWQWVRLDAGDVRLQKDAQPQERIEPGEGASVRRDAPTGATMIRVLRLGGPIGSSPRSLAGGEANGRSGADVDVDGEGCRIMVDTWVSGPGWSPIMICNIE